MRKVYDTHVNKLMKRGDEYAEIAENLKRRRDELRSEEHTSELQSQIGRAHV